VSGKDFLVTRWTRTSTLSAAIAVVVIVALSLLPLFSGANVTERLTTLFAYIILAVMWNALAGYAGLVSVGQQMFFGLGAYGTIRLSCCWPAAPRCRCRPSCCGCAAANSPSPPG
jgi:ABC-type branched-subunit amino acid transport system permease subunit